MLVLRLCGAQCAAHTAQDTDDTDKRNQANVLTVTYHRGAVLVELRLEIELFSQLLARHRRVQPSAHRKSGIALATHLHHAKNQPTITRTHEHVAGERGRWKTKKRTHTADTQT